MSEFHFGYERNGMPCSCGNHWGCGDYSAEQRAAIAARMRDKMPTVMSETMRQYLADFEKTHGKVHYTMGNVGVYAGTFVKESKGIPLQGSIYNSAFDREIHNRQQGLIL